MAGRLALRAEVLGRLDDARAEDLEPEPVDGHAGRQRVVRRDQPLGQPQPVERRARRQRRQERGRRPADLVAPLVVLAALEDVGRLGLARLLAEDQGRRDLVVDLLALLLGLRELRVQRVERPGASSRRRARRSRRSSSFFWASVRFDRSTARIGLEVVGQARAAVGAAGPDPGRRASRRAGRPGASRSRSRPGPSRPCRRAG